MNNFYLIRELYKSNDMRKRWERGRDKERERLSVRVINGERKSEIDFEKQRISGFQGQSKNESVNVLDRNRDKKRVRVRWREKDREREGIIQMEEGDRERERE